MELKHLALIMDGNGRWAEKRNLPRKVGHQEGGKAIEKVVKTCIKEGIKYLTLYCFSTENWKRPQEEVDYLMGLLSKEIVDKIPLFNEMGVRVLFLGNREKLPEKTLISIDKALYETKNNSNIIVQLALNYGGRDELIRACNKAIKQNKEYISEDLINRNLDNPFVPEPDMICRSAGEKRLSGFMLWQSNYAEIGFYDKLWPDWDEEMIKIVIDDFLSRKRKFGALK